MKHLFVIISLVISSYAIGATYYISPTGNDLSGNGSAASPWKTLYKATTIVKTAGDIIYVNPGTYIENTQCNLGAGVSIQGAGVTSVITTTSLTADYQPIIKLASATVVNGNQSISYLKFDGKSLTGSQALWIEARNNVKIHNCTFVDFRYMAVYWRGLGGSETAPPTTYVTGSEFHDNIVTNCAGSTTFFKGALFIGGHDGMLIYNNTMTETGRAVGTQGWPIKIWANGGWVKGLKIYNNTLYKSDVSVWDFAIEALWLYGVEIYNNTITGAIDVNHVIKGTYNYGLYIHHNVLGPQTPQAGYFSGIRPEFDIEDLIVEHNEFRNCAVGLKYSPRSGSVIKGNRISYNVFHDLGRGNSAHYYSGIRMDPGSYTVNDYFVYNNVFHSYSAQNAYYALAMQPSSGRNINIINNIITGFNSYWLTSNFASTVDILNIKNNIIYGNGYNNNLNLGTGTPRNYVNQNNLNVDPLFVSATDFHLRAGSPAIAKGISLGLSKDFAGNLPKNPPTIGAYEYESPIIPIPAFSSASVENASPSSLSMTYDSNLANIVPAASSFLVTVNSTARTVNSAAISGTKVLLTLASPIASGNAVTVAYTKPALNPLQNTSGGQAISIGTRTVSNNCINVPSYVNSSMESSYPSRLEMNYSTSLANIVPAASSFLVMVNSVARSVNSVSISGTKVLLNLSSPVISGNTVTVAYSKPVSNPLQNTSGGQAISIGTRTVTNNIINAPLYVNSSIENLSPTRLELNYSTGLANVIPVASAFVVMVNSVARPVNSVSITASKVLLTLSSPVVYGNNVTVSYSKPTLNPLQNTSGVQAVSTGTRAVTNKITAAPVYVNSLVRKETPYRLEMTYNETLANKIPVASSFSVKVNSKTRSVNSLYISGTKVYLNLSSSVATGNVITVAYTQPSLNPLQNSTGGKAVSISPRSVINNLNLSSTMSFKDKHVVYEGFVEAISPVADQTDGNLEYEWIVPSDVQVASTTEPNLIFLGPQVDESKTVEFKLQITGGDSIETKSIPVEFVPYKHDLEVAEIIKVDASDFKSQNYPENIIDGNNETMWSADGDNNWLILKLKSSFKISHLELAFLSGQNGESYFDILASEDSVNWDPILIDAVSCPFSGGLQVFDFPEAKTDIEYSFIKLVGHGNLINTTNNFSELNVIGYSSIVLSDKLPVNKDNISVYPNPAKDYINVVSTDTPVNSQTIRIFDLSGKLCMETRLDQGNSNSQIPLNLKTGGYIVHVLSGEKSLYVKKLMVVQ